MEGFIPVLSQLDRLSALALGAVLSMFLGLLIERWLFLSEGQHLVNLYHGRQRT